jgi:uncharacterized membrane protein
MLPSDSPTKIDRLSALTDGTYAIVLTLLVIDLKVPEIPGLAGEPELASDLISQLPNFAAYIVSFLVVAYFWMHHHLLFSSLKRCDQKSLLLNLVHVLFITLIPYTTSLIGHYKQDQIAVALFSANIGLAALSLIVLYLYIRQKKQWHDDEHPMFWIPTNWWGLYFGPLLAIASIGASFVSIHLSLGIWLLLPLRNFLVSRWITKSN